MIICKFARVARNRAETSRLVTYVTHETGNHVAAVWTIGLGRGSDDKPIEERATQFLDLAETLSSGVHRSRGKPRLAEHFIISFGASPVSEEKANQYAIRLARENPALQRHAALVAFHRDNERSHLHFVLAEQGYGNAGALSAKLGNRELNGLYRHAHRLGHEILGIPNEIDLIPLGRPNRPRSTSNRKLRGIASQIAREKITLDSNRLKGCPAWAAVALALMMPRSNFEAVTAKWHKARCMTKEMQTIIDGDVVSGWDRWLIDILTASLPDKARVRRIEEMLNEIREKRIRYHVEEARSAISHAEDAESEAVVIRDQRAAMKIPRFNIATNIMGEIDGLRLSDRGRTI